MSGDCLVHAGPIPSASDTSRGRPSLATFETGWVTAAFLPDPRRTFLEVFAERAESSPDAVAFTEVSVHGRELTERAFSFGALWTEAQRAARLLEAHGAGPRDRVILSVSSPSAFAAFYMGAQGIGAIPVPLPSVADFHVPSNFRERVQAVATDCAPSVVVIDSGRARDAAIEAVPSGTVVIDLESADLAAVSLAGPSKFSPRRAFDEIAFIQYTSGSTGKPKGVVVTQYGLVANFRASTEGARFGASDRSFSWLPIFHDMGLIGGLLLGMYLGIATFVMAPRHFILRPDSWLRAIDKYRITFTVGPNFAYNILAKRLPDEALAGLDLSSWRLAFDGAEPIDRATVEAFIARFAAVGFRATSFYPVYGLAENTLSAAFPEPGAPTKFDPVDRRTLIETGRAVPIDASSPDAVSFVGCGRAMPGHALRIVDPESGRELPERTVGEVVLRGPSLSPYYFRKDFDHGPARDELRSGDLGYLAGGDLYLVDRLKDLLIIGGRNYVPSDVERIAGGVLGVRSGAVVAFGTRGTSGTDELVVVVGAEPRSGVLPDALKKELRRVIHAAFGLVPREVVVVRPSAIPKTSSGKLQRAACKRSYESGDFQREEATERA